MGAIEEAGLTKEKFKKMYDDHNGFDNIYPEDKSNSCDSLKQFFLDLQHGAELLCKENPEIVKMIAGLK